jgi:hypothetical protein
MNKFIYAACISSLALTSSVWAARNDDARWKGRAARANATTTHAVKSNRSTQINARRNFSGQHFQQQSFKTHNNAATIRSNRIRNNNQVNLASHPRNLENTRLKDRAATRTARKLATTNKNNVVVNRENNVVVNRDRNVRINREVNRNRTRNAGITNNWRDSRFSGGEYSAFRSYHRQSHNRNWWRSHYNRIVLVGGGWYFWNSGYWYPAWGYDPGYYYPYDGPIYGYNSLAPDQVILNVQAQLQQDGYYSGPVDGQLGPMTRQAIADFQADHGLAVTSAVDQPTLATLGLV